VHVGCVNSGGHGYGGLDVLPPDGVAERGDAADCAWVVHGHLVVSTWGGRSLG
jgi:hypothetical protein